MTDMAQLGWVLQRMHAKQTLARGWRLRELKRRGKRWQNALEKKWANWWKLESMRLVLQHVMRLDSVNALLNLSRAAPVEWDTAASVFLFPDTPNEDGATCCGANYTFLTKVHLAKYEVLTDLEDNAPLRTADQLLTSRIGTFLRTKADDLERKNHRVIDRKRRRMQMEEERWAEWEREELIALLP